MTSGNQPIAALPIDYLQEAPPRYALAFRALAIMAIVYGALKAAMLGAGFYPYIIGGASLPAYYPPAGLEYLLNLLPFGCDILEIAAGIIAVSSGNLRPLIIWAWCGIVVAVWGVLFNLIWELAHAQVLFSRQTGGYVVSHLISVVYYPAASLAVPIMLILLRRMSRREYAKGA